MCEQESWAPLQSPVPDTTARPWGKPCLSLRQDSSRLGDAVMCEEPLCT